MRFLGFLVAALPLCAFNFPMDGTKVEPSEILKAYKDAGYAAIYVSCAGADGMHCFAAFDDAETKDPQDVLDAYVYVDPAIAQAVVDGAFRSLCDELNAGTISPSDLVKLTAMSQAQRRFCADLPALK